MLKIESLPFQLELRIIRRILKIQEEHDMQFNEAIVEFSRDVENGTGEKINPIHLNNWLANGVCVPKAKVVALAEFLGFPIHAYVE